MKNILFIIAIFCITINTMFSQEEEHHYRQHAGLFLGGVTGTAAGGETYFTAGVGYEFMFTGTKPLFGIGLLGEIEFAELKEYLVGIPFFLHPIGGLKMWIAPAMIFREEIKDTVLPEPEKFDEVTKAKNHFLLRFGAGYDFHFNRVSVTPSINFELLENKLYLVYGIGFGVMF